VAKEKAKKNVDLLRAQAKASASRNSNSHTQHTNKKGHKGKKQGKSKRQQKQQAHLLLSKKQPPHEDAHADAPAPKIGRYAELPAGLALTLTLTPNPNPKMGRYAEP
jgi:hypothetical protein